ncbi:hypothetical protein JYG23_05770 [Sedimentibacter sp. zth1]|uniref:hypothetical protein n=1 Tax=Sedimentibacter sp. zth1 TaxID=2816908 RepID=UPI001A910D5B|nr:hypothetical protein [Sedimentibacter sp. zth1]QSX06931.1 hypothetical protein JYG23_05770 [Sedimentibacter sp. zth1]
MKLSPIDSINKIHENHNHDTNKEKQKKNFTKNDNSKKDKQEIDLNIDSNQLHSSNAKQNFNKILNNEQIEYLKSNIGKIYTKTIHK